MLKDGWHYSKVHGCDFYTENGRILRGVRDGVTVYPYRWNGKTQTHDNVSGILYTCFMTTRGGCMK